ncbi:MAG: hypothetical protein Q9227_003661 [Pyrenula ochraceoflavens]
MHNRSYGTSSNDEINDYLILLRQRQRHRELHILRRYLEQLSNLGGAEEGDLRAHSPDSIPGTDQPNRPSLSTVNALSERLELAVLEAKSQLARQQKLLNDLKAEGSHGDGPAALAKRSQALSAVRTELHGWVNDKLVSADLNADEPSPQNGNIGKVPEESTPGDSIRLQYQEYIKARKRLLQVSAVINCPSPAREKIDKPSLPPRESSLPGNSGTIILSSFIREKMLSANDIQKSLSNQRALMTNIFAQEEKSTQKSLAKLRDESHLLPAYPILARQGRFKDVAMKLGPGKADDRRRENQVGDLIEAWAFASGAATTANDQTIHSHLSQGKVSLGDATECLNDLRTEVGQNPSSWTPNENERNDIWTMDIEREENQAVSQNQGPWSGLNGRVGIS